MKKGIRLCGGGIWVLEKGISPLSPKISSSQGVLANAAIEQLTEDIGSNLTESIYEDD